MKRTLVASLLLVLLAACEESAIADKSTEESVAVVAQGSHAMVSPLSDAMDRGNHEYTRNVVVDASYYTMESVARGDIVYYGDNHVARVIALPNEKIKITNGQVYIDGRKLDTFYGTAHVGGYDYRKFKDSRMAEPAKQNLIDEVFKKNQTEITLTNDEVFVMGDDWSRSNPATTFRKLPRKELLGKVMGVCTTCGQ